MGKIGSADGMPPLRGGDGAPAWLFVIEARSIGLRFISGFACGGVGPAVMFVNLHQKRGKPVRQRLRQVIAFSERSADIHLYGTVIVGCFPSIAFVLHDPPRIPGPASMLSGIQHLPVVEFLKEIVEPARSELVAREFQPFLRHGEESGPRARFGRMSCQVQTLGRCPPKFTSLIVLHDGDNERRPPIVPALIEK
jgi:hypothetical protein